MLNNRIIMIRIVVDFVVINFVLGMIFLEFNF